MDPPRKYNHQHLDISSNFQHDIFSVYVRDWDIHFFPADYFNGMPEDASNTLIWHSDHACYDNANAERGAFDVQYGYRFDTSINPMPTGNCFIYGTFMHTGAPCLLFPCPHCVLNNTTRYVGTVEVTLVTNTGNLEIIETNVNVTFPTSSAGTLTEVFNQIASQVAEMMGVTPNI